MSLTANGVTGYYIDEGNRVQDAAAELPGALLEAELPATNGSPARTVAVSPEDLAAYLRAQGLLSSETAALTKADSATGVLTYEAPKNLTPAGALALGFAIVTSAGTVHYPLGRSAPGDPASTYDSATGELLITLPVGTNPADVLSVHLYRPTAGQEQILAGDLFPFGTPGNTSAPSVDLLGAPADPLNDPINLQAVMALAYDAYGDALPSVSPSWTKAGMSFDAIDSAGESRHYYAGRYRFEAGNPLSGVGPCWKTFLKLQQ